MPPDDQKVIKFPGIPFKIGATHVVATPDPVAKMAVSNLTFSCTSCGTTCSADFQNMIFKTCDFFCKNCGSNFKIVNPAFGVAAKSKK